ncbi:MAG: hypothetical protein R3220_11320 [Balneolaceae bacterium]|nr:hypothetical protein [Balneolaceae bacterium]
MNQEKFDKSDALNVIEEMVNSSRYKMKNEAKYFLLWGWMVFAAAVLQFVLLNVGVSNSWIAWPVMMGLAAVIYVGMIWSSKQESRATSYIDRINRYLWLGFFGPLIISIMVGIYFSWFAAYPLFMAIYGWAAIVSGGILKFKPLVWGGIVSCILGAVTVFVPGMYILLMLALAILAGFIIPGHALSRAES